MKTVLAAVIGTVIAGQAIALPTTTRSVVKNTHGNNVEFAFTSRNTAMIPVKKKLIKGIRLALKKSAVNGGCPMVAININPGTVTRNLFLVAARSATGVDNLKPRIKTFESTHLTARWKHGGVMSRVCLSFNGNGHANMWGADHKMWAGNFSPWEVKPTTSLYVN